MSFGQSAVLIESCRVATFSTVHSQQPLPIVVGVHHSRVAFHSSVCVAFPVIAILVDESTRWDVEPAHLAEMHHVPIYFQ